MPKSSAEAAGRVLVLASINVDHTLYLDQLPAPGETVLARSASTGLGGKGANQSVAAARMGAEVSVIGAVGSDEAGEFAVAEMTAAGLSTELLTTSPDEPTGAAYIFVAADGENSIAVLSGANASVDEAAIGTDPAEPAYAVGLTQGELPPTAVERFARHCADSGTRFVLNLAPVISLADDVVALADPLIVNETEAVELATARLGGSGAAHLDIDAALALAARLADGIARSVVITLGGDGAVVHADGAGRHQPAPAPEQVVDTTGAGDAFVGVVAWALSAGHTLPEAVAFGVAAGSYSVAHAGTTGSYPTWEQIESTRSAASQAAG